MKRADFRDSKTFAKDILFSTQLEEFWIKVYIKQIIDKFDKVEYEDFGTDNTGKVTKYATSKADYKVITYKDKNKITNYYDIKWGPTKGKVTFKVHSLRAYIKQKHSILLFYNVGRKKLKKPRDHKLKQHIQLIEDNIADVRYTILSPETMIEILDTYPHNKVYYMGNKPSVIIPECDFYNFWKGKKIDL